MPALALAPTELNAGCKESISGSYSTDHQQLQHLPESCTLQHERKAVLHKVKHGEAPTSITPVIVKLAHLNSK